MVSALKMPKYPFFWSFAVFVFCLGYQEVKNMQEGLNSRGDLLLSGPHHSSLEERV